MFFIIFKTRQPNSGLACASRALDLLASSEALPRASTWLCQKKKKKKGKTSLLLGWPQISGEALGKLPLNVHKEVSPRTHLFPKRPSGGPYQSSAP